MTRLFDPKMQFCWYHREGTYSFAGSTDPKHTVLQTYREKEINIYFGLRYVFKLEYSLISLLLYNLMIRVLEGIKIMTIVYSTIVYSSA